MDVWLCPNCGQWHFADHPSEMCAFCKDFTTWLRMPSLGRGVDTSDPLIMVAMRLGAWIRLAQPDEWPYPPSPLA